MKIQWKKITIFVVIQLLILNASFALDRVDSLFLEDAQRIMDSLEKEEIVLKQTMSTFNNIEKHLQKNIKGQNVYLQFEVIAGSVILVGVVIGGLKNYFPPGYRAMLSAYLTVKGLGRGVVKLTEEEVLSLSKKLDDLNKQLLDSKRSLENQKKYYCGIFESHSLCH